MATVDLDFDAGANLFRTIDQGDYSGDTVINAKPISTSIFTITNESNVDDFIDLTYTFPENLYNSSTSIDIVGANVKFDGVTQSKFASHSFFIYLKENATLHLTPEYLSQESGVNYSNANYTNVIMEDSGASKLIFDAQGLELDSSRFTIASMTPGDTIEVVGATNYSYELGTVVFKNDDGNAVGRFHISNFKPEFVNFRKGVMSYACYLKGTHIATSEGEIKVEDLKIGDSVTTASGGTAKVKWLGYRTLYKNRIPEKDAKRAFPILFKKGCIADNVPYRDLIMSPGHHVSFDGNLVSAMNLVNGTSIVQLCDMPSFQYFHVELEQFDILLAEGVPAESYVDTGNRNMFQNAHEVAINPNFGPATGRPDVPGITVVRQGPVLEAIRAKLLERAEWMKMSATQKRSA